LLSDGVLDQFLPGERAAVHATIAEVLAERPALSTGPGELGYHQAQAGDLPAALASHLAAADDAERVYAFADAAAYLERALELWSGVPQAAERTRRSRGDVLVDIAQNLGGAGDFDRAVAYATAALAEPEIAGDSERGAELWQRIARYHLQDGNGQPAFTAYQTAAKLLDSAFQAQGRSRLAAEHALALAIWGREEEAITQAERALRLADDDSDLAARGLALNASGVARVSAGRLEDGERDAREALDLARAHGSHDDIGRAMLNLGHLLLSVGRNEESLELSERAIAESEASGLDLRRGAMNRNNACEALFALGRWGEAIAQADTVRSRIEFRFASRMACVIRARVATARGEDDLAMSLCPGWKPMARA
jgi:tetratricopeptide (TPR) repeat protein